MSETTESSKTETLASVATIVTAYVSRNSLSLDDLIGLIQTVQAAVTGEAAAHSPSAIEPRAEPAVSIRKSITPAFIICLEDGKKLKMLKRHLRTSYNMTPEEYRAKWGLPESYPMVAPNYAARRSELAKQNGLGRHRTPAEPPTKPVKAKKAK